MLTVASEEFVNTAKGAALAAQEEILSHLYQNGYDVPLSVLLDPNFERILARIHDGLDDLFASFNELFCLLKDNDLENEDFNTFFKSLYESLMAKNELCINDYVWFRKLRDIVTRSLLSDLRLAQSVLSDLRLAQVVLSADWTVARDWDDIDPTDYRLVAYLLSNPLSVSVKKEASQSTDST